jgi:hypothetical protein
MEHIFADMLELFFFKLALYVTTTIKILCMHGNNINQVNHFQYVTCEIIENIIEWAMISKCFFGADFAKC